MLKKQVIIFLLLTGFLAPTGISLMSHFMSSTGEGRLVMNMLNMAEEETKEEQKTEKENEEEKQISFVEFKAFLLSFDKFTYIEIPSGFHLLKGNPDSPTPPPKIS